MACTDAAVREMIRTSRALTQTEVPVAEPLFIGGTGRSGTSRMVKVLGSHRDVHPIEWESRFIVDAGGLEDLARELTVEYDPYAAADAILRLSHMFDQYIPGRTATVFRGWGLVDEIGANQYWTAVDRLFAELCWYEFEPKTYPARYRYGQVAYLPDERPTQRFVVGRYFRDRAELIAVLRGFVASLFDPLARAAGKRTWVEKTPFNVLSVPFLLELFPDARVIHMIRDPLYVVASHLHQSWAPDDLEGVLNWVEPVYRRILDQRPALLSDPRYVEVRLEDAAADWPAVRASILSRLDLDDDPAMLGFDADAVHHRRDQPSADDRGRVLDRLGDVREQLGY